MSDFRVSASDEQAERAALAAARRILTSHPELLRQFGERSVVVPWATSSVSPYTRSESASSFVLFVGPTIGRKGCYEVRAAVRALNLPLIVLGRCLEGADFWEGMDVRQLARDADLSTLPAVVVQPSLWEARPPVPLLRALDAGIPVIATLGCGLGDRAGVTTVPFGDAAALTAALADRLRDFTIE